MKMKCLNRASTVDLWERDEGALGPPGATWLETEQGWNFTLYSRHATGVTLLLYNATDFVEPVFQLQLDPLKNKTARIWHCLVQREFAPAARYYGFRVQGPWDPKNGHRFDPEKILFDPYAEELFFPPNFLREAARHSGRNDGRAVLGVLPREEAEFDWGTQQPPRHTHDAVVYELHVKGFTARHNSGVARGETRNISRTDRENSIPKGTRCDGGGIIAGASVRSAGGQLLGLHDDGFPRAAPRLRSARRGGRVSADGASVSSRRESKFGWTLFTTTPPKATKLGRCIRTAVSIIAAITC